MTLTRNRIIAAATAVGIAGGLAIWLALSAFASGSAFQERACVTFGHGNTAAGNVMLYDWNDSACPPGTYPVKLAEPGPAPTVTVTATTTVTSSPSSSPTASATATH